MKCDSTTANLTSMRTREEPINCHVRLAPVDTASNHHPQAILNKAYLHTKLRVCICSQDTVHPQAYTIRYKSLMWTQKLRVIS